MNLSAEFRRLLEQTEHDGIDFLDLYVDDLTEFPIIIFDCFIRARHHGDEALTILAHILTQLSTNTGRPIRYQTIPIHEGSRALFERHPEYHRIPNHIPTTYVKDFP